MQQKNFDSIAQRILFAYRFSYSDFAPAEAVQANSNIAGTESQKALHALMKDMLNKLYQNPQLLGLPTDADHAYPWELCSNRIPEWNQVYLTVNKILYEFYRFLLVTATYGDVTADSLQISKQLLKELKSVYKPAYKNTLSVVGIDIRAEKEKLVLCCENTPEIFYALQLLGKQNQKAYCMYQNDHPSVNTYHNLFCFAACSFNGKLDYLLSRVDEMYAMNGLLLRLKESCESKGYLTEYKVRLSPTDYNLRIEIKTTVGGFLMEYNSRKEWKVGFGTMNGIGEKAMLEDFAALDDDMKDYFIRICRPCTACQGCTKGGKSKMFTIKVLYQGKETALCPMFPQHTWETLNQELIDCLMKYHTLQLRYANNEK